MHHYFDDRAHDTLKHYVYALFDPTSTPERLFYVGKGQRNRVFDHARGELVRDDQDTLLNPKLDRIKKIKKQGHKVTHVIVRHGLEDAQAKLVEASLIDFVNHLHPGWLTNKVRGRGVVSGIRDTRDLAVELNATPLEIHCNKPKLLVFVINKQWNTLLGKYAAAANIPDYEILRSAEGDWARLSLSRAGNAEYILATALGIVRGVYKSSRWYKRNGKARFVGMPVGTRVKADFVGKTVPPPEEGRSRIFSIH